MNVLRTALGEGKEYGNVDVDVFSFRVDCNLLFLLLCTVCRDRSTASALWYKAVLMWTVYKYYLLTYYM